MQNIPVTTSMASIPAKRRDIKAMAKMEVIKKKVGRPRKRKPEIEEKKEPK